MFLNFYAKKYREIQEESREVDMGIPSATVASNEPILSAILDIGDQVTRIGTGKGQGQNGYRYSWLISISPFLNDKFRMPRIFIKSDLYNKILVNEWIKEIDGERGRKESGVKEGERGKE